jgi:hypothetical protein
MPRGPKGEKRPADVIGTTVRWPAADASASQIASRMTELGWPMSREAVLGRMYRTSGDIMSGPHLALRFNPTSEHRDHFLAFSGGLLVGWVEADAGKWQWSMFGVHITGDSGAKLQGICDTLEGAERELSGSWLAWVEWAGLQPKR